MSCARHRGMMNRVMRTIALVITAVLLPLLSAYAEDGNEDFLRWVAQFKKEAQNQGIPESVLEDAFSDIHAPNASIIRLDRKQPERTISFTKYITNTITPSRIAEGRALLEEHRDLLRDVSAQYQVQPHYIIALWGMETNYGSNTGNFSLIEALATLAYEGRRAAFFKEELIKALRIMASENIQSADFTGSWAGAMGNCQFMPSSYINFAVDWDQDGKRDIWNSLPDTFASIANYLHQSGWNGMVEWGGAVNVPTNFTGAEARLDTPRSIDHWRSRGLTPLSGGAFTDYAVPMYAVYPGVADEGVYLVSENYKVLLKWNRSRYFATAVGTLADRLTEQY